MRNIITLLPSDLSVILLMTYCYSRSWLVRPDLIGAGSDELLERYLNIAREQAQVANVQDEHLVLLIFGHEDEDMSDVAVGGTAPRKRPYYIFGT